MKMKLDEVINKLLDAMETQKEEPQYEGFYEDLLDIMNFQENEKFKEELKKDWHLRIIYKIYVWAYKTAMYCNVRLMNRKHLLNKEKRVQQYEKNLGMMYQNTKDFAELVREWSDDFNE